MVSFLCFGGAAKRPQEGSPGLILGGTGAPRGAPAEKRRPESHKKRQESDMTPGGLPGRSPTKKTVPLKDPGVLLKDPGVLLKDPGSF